MLGCARMREKGVCMMVSRQRDSVETSLIKPVDEEGYSQIICLGVFRDSVNNGEAVPYAYHESDTGTTARFA